MELKKLVCQGIYEFEFVIMGICDAYPPYARFFSWDGSVADSGFVIVSAESGVIQSGKDS